MGIMASIGNLISGSKSQLLEKAVLIDVRSTAEYESGHLNKAISLPLNQIEHNISSFISDKTALIIVYCQSGLRALTAYKRLRELGYSNVVNGGGIEQLSKSMNQAIELK